MIIKPNTHRGKKQYPDLIIIHAMSEYIQSLHASDFLEMIGLSAHYLIEVNGDVMECVNPRFQGIHAKGFNQNSIGIEVLVEGENSYSQFIKKIKTNWVKPKQMESLIQLCKNCYDKYPIDAIKRHSDIDPERKKDPGSGFDWNYFKDQL